MWSGTPDVAGWGMCTTATESCPVTGGSSLGRAPEGSKGNICLGREKGTRAQSLLLLCDM